MQLPIDNAWVPMPLMPWVRANWSTRSTTLSTTATDFALQTGTRFVRLIAQNVDVFVNFTNTSTDAVTTSSFDAVVLAELWPFDYQLPEWVTTINGITASGTANFIIIEY